MRLHTASNEEWRCAEIDHKVIVECQLLPELLHIDAICILILPRLLSLPIEAQS